MYLVPPVGGVPGGDVPGAPGRGVPGGDVPGALCFQSKNTTVDF